MPYHACVQFDESISLLIVDFWGYFSVVIFEIDGSHTLLHMPFTCPEFARMTVGLVVARMLYEHFLFGCHAV